MHANGKYSGNSGNTGLSMQIMSSITLCYGKLHHSLYSIVIAYSECTINMARFVIALLRSNLMKVNDFIYRVRRNLLDEYF